MNVTFRYFCVLLLLEIGVFVSTASLASAQVDPREITDPNLKSLERTYLKKLVEVRRQIRLIKFPFTFSVNRYAGLDPKQQASSDDRGLEFVNFHGRVVLKVTGNYNAAYSASLLTPNQRANRTFDDVIQPILGILSESFSADSGFDDFGLEIAHHVRSRIQGVSYEGKEILAVVISKADALLYLSGEDQAHRQRMANHSEIFLNGQPLVLKLGAKEPYESAQQAAEEEVPLAAASRPPDAPTTISGADSQSSAASAASAQANAQRLQEKYQKDLEALAKEGTPRFSFVDYAPPEFIPFQDQVFLQLTLRNPEMFDKDETSIYKRAARSFDLFLAPQIKNILQEISKIEVSGISMAVIDQLSSGGSSPASEVVEFFFSRNALQRFADAAITNQELINQSVVLVNGVRIALDLQRVE